MKFKLLASSVLMASALMGSGAASATTVWGASGTLADWENGTMTLVDYGYGSGSQSSAGGVGTITDGDGDMTYTASALTALTGGLATLGAANILVGLTEDEVGGKDLYTITFASRGLLGYTGANGATISYNITSLSLEEPINSAAFDTTVVDTLETATKQLYDIGATTPFLTLTSIYGAPDPVNGEYYFPGRQSINVVDTLNPNGGNIKSISNQFNVPEPTTLIMLGLGLAAFGYSRRGAKGLSA